MELQNCKSDVDLGECVSISEIALRKCEGNVKNATSCVKAANFEASKTDFSFLAEMKPERLELLNLAETQFS